jgi:hypothetical protein
MDQPPYGMDERCRQAVLTALRERCADRQWRLPAAQVRTAHVPLVVEAEVRPERSLGCITLSKAGHGMGVGGGSGMRRMCQRPFGVVAGQGNPMAVCDSLDGEERPLPSGRGFQGSGQRAKASSTFDVEQGFVFVAGQAADDKRRSSAPQKSLGAKSEELSVEAEILAGRAIAGVIG